MAIKAFKANKNKFIKDDIDKTNQTVVNLSNKLKNNKSKNLTYMPNIRAMEESIFLIPNTKKTLNYLKQPFIKTLIFQYFDLKYHYLNWN